MPKIAVGHLYFARVAGHAAAIDGQFFHAFYRTVFRGDRHHTVEVTVVYRVAAVHKATEETSRHDGHTRAHSVHTLPYCHNDKNIAFREAPFKSAVALRFTDKPADPARGIVRHADIARIGALGEAGIVAERGYEPGGNGVAIEIPLVIFVDEIYVAGGKTAEQIGSRRIYAVRKARGGTVAIHAARGIAALDVQPVYSIAYGTDKAAATLGMDGTRGVTVCNEHLPVPCHSAYETARAAATDGTRGIALRYFRTFIVRRTERAHRTDKTAGNNSPVAFCNGGVRHDIAECRTAAERKVFAYLTENAARKAGIIEHVFVRIYRRIDIYIYIGMGRQTGQLRDICRGIGAHGTDNAADAHIDGRPLGRNGNFAADRTV